MFARAPTLKLSIPKVHPVQNTATGMSALSIWMKDTERYRYAAFPSHNVPAPYSLYHPVKFVPSAPGDRPAFTWACHIEHKHVPQAHARMHRSTELPVHLHHFNNRPCRCL